MAKKPKFKSDPLYLKLKEALALADTDRERSMVQATITSLRHESAWEDPDSPLEKRGNPEPGHEGQSSLRDGALAHDGAAQD